MDSAGILLFGSLAALIGLPIGGILGLRHHYPAAGWTMLVLWIVLVSAMIVRVAWVRRKQAQERAARIAGRQRDGIRPRSPMDQVVPHAEWREVWELPANWHDWVEGEARKLMPEDTLLKWEWRSGPRSGAGGYAVERKGKIIAQIRLWIS